VCELFARSYYLAPEQPVTSHCQVQCPDLTSMPHGSVIYQTQHLCVISLFSAAVNHVQQTEPPSIAITDLFPDGGPEGEIQEYLPLQDG